jgi:glycosyltransferase involved in cell wall biosynthesis
MARSPVRVAYICKAVSEESPVVATQVAWIRSLASLDGVHAVTVLTPKAKPVSLPANVTVSEFGRGYRGLFRFFFRAIKVARSVDFFLVVQGGPYPALLLPIKLAWRRPIYQWKAHSHVSPRMEFYARWCDDLLFTATESSLPIDSPKVRVVGHGIDTDAFRPREPRSPERNLLYVGRVAPIKRLDSLLRAVSACNRRYGTDYRLDIVGPGQTENIDELLASADSPGQSAAVRYLGIHRHSDLPELMSHYWAMANFSRTALDKSALEAMACGLPVVTTNKSTLEALPTDLRQLLGADEGDEQSEAEAIHRVMSLEREAYGAVAEAVRELVVRDHSLDRLFAKIMAHIEGHRSTTSSS